MKKSGEFPGVPFSGASPWRPGRGDSAGVCPRAGSSGFDFGGWREEERSKELATDLVVVGGGLGGCAAALAAARNGLRVIITEETDWIGGQLTAQAVPPDENPWIETFGGTRSYLNLRQQIREYYLRHYPLTAEARAKPFLNPGNGWVSRLCMSRACRWRCCSSSSRRM